MKHRKQSVLSWNKVRSTLSGSRKRNAGLMAGALATLLVIPASLTLASWSVTEHTSGKFYVPAPAIFASVSAGKNHVLALDNAGNAYAWGDNTYGQLGDGTQLKRTAPVKVQMPAGVTFTGVSAGAVFSLALGSDNKLYSWGDNSLKQLGQGSSPINLSKQPLPITASDGVTTFSDVSAGTGFALATAKDSKKTYSWGSVKNGELGTGNGPSLTQTTPGQVKQPDASVFFDKISAGTQSAMAIGSDKNTYYWGLAYSVSGYSWNAMAPLIANVPGATMIIGAGGNSSAISAGNSQGFAVTNTGSASGMGVNNTGSLGDGTTATQNFYIAGPIGTQQVKLPDGVSITAVTSGNDFTVATTSTGMTYSWGQNGSGQTMRPTSSPFYNIPGAITATTTNQTFTSVSAGADFVVAIGTDNKTYTWGPNASGQLGQGSTGGSSANPTVVFMPQGASTSGLANSGATNTLSAPETPIDTDTPSAPEAPALSDPASQTVSVGDTAQFHVDATGEPAPSITWEVSTDNGASWNIVDSDSAGLISADGTTLTFTAVTVDLDGRQYRATATNSIGSHTSAPATLSVHVAPPTPAIVSPTPSSTPPENAKR